MDSCWKSNTNNSLRYLLFPCTSLSEHKQFNLISAICFHTVKWLNSSIWFKDATLTGTKTSGHSGSGSMGSEGFLHIRHSSRLGIPPLTVCVIYRTFVGGVTPLLRCSRRILHSQLSSMIYSCVIQYQYHLSRRVAVVMGYEVCAFLEDICPKSNVITSLKFEHA